MGPIDTHTHIVDLFSAILTKSKMCSLAFLLLSEYDLVYESFYNVKFLSYLCPCVAHMLVTDNGFT